MRNIETFPSKQMYPYLSLDERKVAEFYHDIDRRFGLVKMTYFHQLFRTIDGVLIIPLGVSVVTHIFGFLSGVEVGAMLLRDEIEEVTVNGPIMVDMVNI